MTSPMGEVGFEAGGQRYTLVYDINTLCALEDELDLDAIEIVMRLAGGARLKFQRTVFRAGLRGAGDHCPEAAAGAVMTHLTAKVARDKMLAAMSKAFPKPEEGNTDADPPKPEADGTGPASSEPGAAST